LLFPGFIGLSLAQQTVPESYWAIFIMGAVAMRSAGCIYNDIIDRPFDGRVARTKNRPLVRKDRPLSLLWALVFLAFNLIIGLACLIQFNFKTILVGVVAACMIALYPWMKRITYWPQLFLGLTMNMGLVIGIYAVGLNLDVGIISMYAGMISWTFGYDTIYGFQDMEDDILVGIKSTTFKVRAAPKSFVTTVYGASIFLWLIAGKVMGLSPFYYLGISSIFILFLWQVLTLESNNAANCLMRFRSNQWVGVLLFLSIIIK